MRRFSIMAACLALALSAAVPLAAQSTAIQPPTAAPATEARTLPLKSGGKLTVSNVNGGIKISAWDRDEVELTAKFKADSDGRHAQVEANGDSDSLELVVKQPNGIQNGLTITMFGYRNAACNLELKVPHRVAASIKTVKGAIAFEGLSGDLRAHTGMGVIKGGIQGIENRLNLSTELGSIAVKLSNPDGRLNASTELGRVKLLAPGAKGVESSRHRVRAKFGEGKADLIFKTALGSITIE